jgi:hypothetical protein
VLTESAQRQAETKPDEFVYFSRLPLELQEMTWTLHTEHRIVFMTRAGDKKHKFLAYPYTPPILSASVQSRSMAMKHYCLFDNNHDTTVAAKNKIYLDFDQDTFFSLQVDRDGLFTEMCPTIYPVALHSLVKHLATSPETEFHSFTSSFTALKSVTIAYQVSQRMEYDPKVRNYVERISLQTFTGDSRYGELSVDIKVEEMAWKASIERQKRVQPSLVPFTIFTAGSRSRLLCRTLIKKQSLLLLVQVRVYSIMNWCIKEGVLIVVEHIA